nr:HTH-type transcriptional regulator PecS-like [Nerophis lumbriciformis]
MGIVGRIMRLGRRFTEDANEAIKPQCLRYTDFDIIATLRRSGRPYRLTPVELCEAVVLTSGAMTAALERVERVKLIARQPSKTDRRVKAAVLTAKGVRVAEAAARLRFRAAHLAVGCLSVTEARQLVSLLRKLSLHAE